MTMDAPPPHDRIQFPTDTQPEIGNRDGTGDPGPSPRSSTDTNGILSSFAQPECTCCPDCVLAPAAPVRRASTTSIAQREKQETYRFPRYVMLINLFAGVLFVVALHLWYTYWDGKPALNQEFALRVGTFLAYYAQVCFVYSIQIAFAQYLWREVKTQILSVRTIDSGFAALTDAFAFGNREMWSKLRITSVLALTCWLFFIPTVFTPATLNVQPVLVPTTSETPVPVLDISQPNLYTSYSYAVIGNPPNLQKFLGPRTIITRIATAAAATGDLLALPPPATNATYLQTFFGPYVHCENSTENIRQQLSGMIERTMLSTGPTLETVSMDYFAAIPALNNLDITSGSPVEVANLTDIDYALHASNELWLYFSHYNASRDFSEPREDHYLTCSLYNASYLVNFTWFNGRQNVEVEKRQRLNKVFYPANASSTAASELQMSYSGIFWALANQFTGSIAFYRDLNASDDATQQTYASRTYSKISSNIGQTVLIGTSDLASHFAENHLLGNASDGSQFSTQRLQDVAYARNRTLDVLIPELSSNITISLLADSLLAPNQASNVTISTIVNQFIYQSQNLMIAYVVAGTVALLANVTGLYAFIKNGVCHDLNFSSIACSSHGIHFSRDLRAHETRGAAPLPDYIADTQLEFLDDGGNRHGFAEAEKQELQI